MWYVLLVLYAFVAGMAFANWCNGSEARERGERWGRATREWLGLPPIENKG